MASDDLPRIFSMIDLAPVHEKLSAIATAHTDYAKSSFEAQKAYVEAALKAPDKAMQLTTDHMRSAYDTFVAESKKIGEMYKTFFASAFRPVSTTTFPAREVV